ncbi:MAG: hypothetical protein ACFFAO_13150 [Candidatus Hermodarchaeota archaeon]
MKSKICCTLFLTWFLLLLFSSFAFAATPKYVGIEANDTYIFEAMYDEDVYEGYYEDVGEEYGDTTAQIEQDIDDYIDIKEDIVGIKIVILDVDDEEKETFGEDGVRIIYNYYEKEEDEDWDLKNKDETWAVFDFDEDVYEALWIFGFFWQYSDEGEIQKLESENAWFVSTKVKWGDIKEEIEDHFDDYGYDDYKVKINKDNNRIEMSHDYDDDDEIGKWKEIIEYDDNGVLRYYEEIYDGDTFVKVEREWNEVRQFVLDNLLWVILGVIGIVAVIVVIIIVVIKKR